MSAHSDTIELMLRTIIDISRDNAFQEADILSLEERVRTLSSEDEAVRLKNLEGKLRVIQDAFEKVMANPERKIPMIKLHRAIFNTGLRESKLAVEGSALWSRCTLQSPVEVVGWNASDEPQRKW